MRRDHARGVSGARGPVGGTVAIVGRGRMGRSLVEALEAHAPGTHVELEGREPRRPAPATVVFCVPDDALEAAVRVRAEAFAPGRADGAVVRGASGSRQPPDRVALHTSGVHPGSILSPLREVGFAVAAWHPLTVVDRPDGAALVGVTWGLEGDAAAVGRATELAEALRGRTLRLAPDQHARYHAAAVFASNFLVACLGVAADELRRAASGASVGPDAAPDVEPLLPLARAALEAVARGGVRRGLTGPVARGDAGTVRRHLEVLDGERRELYRALAHELLRLAGPDLAPDRAAAIRAALAPRDDAGA